MNDSYDALTNVVAHISDGYRRAFLGGGGLYSPPESVGKYLPNTYGLYDLVGSRPDLLLDQWNSSEAAAASAGTDPVGMADATRNTRMICNSFSNYKKLSQWSIAFANSLKSDAEPDTSAEVCYRYVIHLNPPQSFGGKWFNE